MKKRLKEMEDEAASLREMQAKVEKEMGAVQGLSFSSLNYFIYSLLQVYHRYMLLQIFFVIICIIPVKKKKKEILKKY